ncbi:MULTISPECIES: hypothetical protein [Streptomyces]|uniref:hypothetical protein n=1 Tax=Streptomyces TaxID=1883 RepID=UPI0029A1993C|nr:MULTISPECIES: hypothetical protein [Streptomyces]MDX3068960.1 hypothetical protein [Streptomyces sp. ND04-05B]MDX3519441.1 hypothetical protein [Streptomyces scabiei]
MYSLKRLRGRVTAPGDARRSLRSPWGSPASLETGAGEPARTPRRSETAIPSPRITVELPLAQHILPSGLASSTYKRFNQVRKSLATAYYLHITHHGMLSAEDIASLGQHQMATAARSAGVEAPTSDETREMIRSLLRVFNGIDAPASAPVPVPTAKVTESELATALDGLAVVVKAAAQGVSR